MSREISEMTVKCFHCGSEHPIWEMDDSDIITALRDGLDYVCPECGEETYVRAAVAFAAFPDRMTGEEEWFSDDSDDEDNEAAEDGEGETA